tara:strand:- start:51291 stop:52736 length:1446 start_codon:yes stop_codon:yes gene_type:complete
MLSNINLREEEQKTIISSSTFLGNDREKLCLFSHFDIDNIIDEYVLFFIKELYFLGYDIVFVTTSENMKINELKKLENYIVHGIVRKNIGYDFISWKIGLSKIDNYFNYQQILNVNDSIFFPINNPRPMFEEMKKRKVDFWGINKSIYYEEFIESFFIVFNKNIIVSVFFNKFWNDCKIYLKKSEVIREYELKLLKLVKENYFKTSSYVDYKALLDVTELNSNEMKRLWEVDKTAISYRFWDTQLEKFNSPFIKKKILIKTHIDYNSTTYNWEAKLKLISRYNTKLIKNYLIRMEKENEIIYDAEFFYNIEQLYKVFKILDNKMFNIYGYGSFGVFINTIFNENIINIFDMNCEILSKSYNRDIYSPTQITDFKNKNFLITALGNEDIIKSFLTKNNIKNENIYSFSKNFKNIELFSYKFLKLICKINNFYFYRRAENEECYFYSGNKELLEILNLYYKRLNINFFEIKNEESKNSLTFSI